MGTWWASWVSNPWCGANNVVGRFDSDAPPPFFLNSVFLNSVSLNSVFLDTVFLNSVSLNSAFLDTVSLNSALR